MKLVLNATSLTPLLVFVINVPMTVTPVMILGIVSVAMLLLIRGN